MKDKAIITVILSIFIFILGIVLNFQEFLMGSPATIKNLIVTFVYFSAWTFVMRISVKSKNYLLIKYYSGIWIATLITAIITVYINITDVIATWALPFAILFLTQWYGIRFFVGSLLTVSIIIAILSFIMFSIAVLSLRKN